jgi:triacylglycerol lipase
VTDSPDDESTSGSDNGRDGDAAMAAGLRTVFSRSGLQGGALEVAWWAAHAASYPFGVAQERARPAIERFSLGNLRPVHRGLLISDVEAAGTPILLVHGLVDNRSIFTVLRRQLKRRGFGRVWTMNYRIWTTDIRDAAHQLGGAVEEICAETGYERIHVVGHSMGGLIARYYVQRLGGDARVHTVVTLGTPHRGTRTARLLPRGIFGQLSPRSALVAELAEPAPGCRSRFVAFWSDIDVMMSPKQTARLEHPDLKIRNIFIRGVGHMSLPVAPRVVREIAAMLAQLDSDGGTVSAGITRLGRASRPAADDPQRASSPRLHRYGPTAR